MTPASEAVLDAAVEIVEALESDTLTKAELVERTTSSPSTVQRALEWLREAGAPIGFCRVDRVWYLDHPWRIPTMLLPCWALRAELRALAGDQDPLELLRLAAELGLRFTANNTEISTDQLD